MTCPRFRSVPGILLTLAFILFSVRPTAAQGEIGRGWYLVRILAGTPEARTAAARGGLDIVGADEAGLVARVTPAQWRELQRAGLPMEVLGREPAAVPIDPAYHTFEEVEAFLQAVTAEHADITFLTVIGRSHGGRPVYAVKISDFPQSDEEDEPAVLLYSLLHAREHLSTEMALYALEALTSGYGVDGMVTNLVNTREIWVLPNMNPDGDVYDVSGGYYHYWRKNRRPNPDASYGVDLNRNFGYRWGCCGGASDRPRDEAYRGPAPFSEPESSALRDFVPAHPNITLALGFHTYGEMILWPYGYTFDAAPPDMDPVDRQVFQIMAGRMAELNGYHPMQASQLYLTDGSADDWLYGTEGIYAFTFEMYPRYSTPGFYPPGDDILRESARNWPAILYAMSAADAPRKVAGEPGDVQPPAVTLVSPPAGAYVGRPILLRAAAEDDVGITLVEFVADGVSIGLDAEAPFELTWEDAPAVGVVALSARAYDAGGNVGASQEVRVHFSAVPPAYLPLAFR